jgi:hypothetical protein
MLEQFFDGVVFLTWSNWWTEPRSNRYHYATRFARTLPVLFVQVDGESGSIRVESADHDNILLAHVYPTYDEPLFTTLARLIRKQNIRKPLFWVYNAYFAPFLDRYPSALAIFHASEAYFVQGSTFKAVPDPESLFPPIYRMLERSDLMVAVSPAVLTSYQETTGYQGSAIVLNNGCDFNFWHSAQAYDYVEPPEGRRVVFFQGTIANQIDYELLNKLTELLPAWSFWFCGRNNGNPGWMRLLERPNVRYFGEVSLEQVARLARSASVALNPYIQETLIQVSAPLKAYEYVACGLPVVSVPIDVLAGRPELFRISRTAAEFAEAIIELAPTRDDPEKISARLEAAKLESYDAKFARLEETIAELVKRGPAQPVQGLNILVLYDDRSTHVSTIKEHLASFAKYSGHNVFYGVGTSPSLASHDGPAPYDLDSFDVVVLHYCVRVSIYSHLNERLGQALAETNALKVLFIQDEYDCTHIAWEWMQRIGFDVVYTCVPLDELEKVYPRRLFPGVTFIQTLTGYVPEYGEMEEIALPIEDRKILIGYRGRDLPHQYGVLGFEKYKIGRDVKKLAEARGLPIDIEVETSKRIYGDDWYRFLGSARATLGTESGSQLFDYDGSLLKVAQQLADRPFEEVYEEHFASYDNHVRMNQISPKIFEAIRLRTALVLFEGEYSGVVKPDLHYIALKKDYSNIDEVFDKINDLDLIRAITDRAYADVIESGRYSYRSFVEEFDAMVAKNVRRGPRAMLLSRPFLRIKDDHVMPLRSEQAAMLLGDFILGGKTQREQIWAGAQEASHPPLARETTLPIVIADQLETELHPAPSSANQSVVPVLNVVPSPAETPPQVISLTMRRMRFAVENPRSALRQVVKRLRGE